MQWIAVKFSSSELPVIANVCVKTKVCAHLVVCIIARSTVKISLPCVYRLGDNSAK